MDDSGIPFLLGLAIGYVLGIVFLAMVVCRRKSDTDREHRRDEKGASGETRTGPASGTHFNRGHCP